MSDEVYTCGMTEKESTEVLCFLLLLYSYTHSLMSPKNELILKLDDPLDTSFR